MRAIRLVLLSIFISAGCDSKSNSNGVLDLGTDPKTRDANDTPIVDAATGIDTRPSNPSCIAATRPPQNTEVSIDPVFQNISVRSPTFLTQAPGDDSKWYSLNRAGFVEMFDNNNDATDATTFVDITDRISAGGERGLLGIAWHPNWQQNNEIFLSYTAGDGGLHSRFSRFQINNGIVDTSTEEIILRIDQPFGNHNGGGIDFGPDGFLYIGMGDGGDGGDPLNSGQDVSTLLGAFLRIDVDNGTPYAIPADNPFASGGGRPEIYAWGVRNPWRWSFDRATGELWAGDVGQNLWEEVSIIERGGNYGWREKEGTNCFSADPPCDDLPYIDPVVEYDHSLGESITGGYVYRGTDVPSLIGKYIFGDFETGRIWAVVYDDITGEPEAVEIARAPFKISSFGQSNDGEVYVVDWDNGRFYKINGPDTTPSNFPQTLSATGCVDANDPTKVIAGAVPYDLNAPFWSDAATKRRFMAIPDEQTLTVGNDGDINFPVGTVLLKEFSVDGKRVETRLFMHHDDGDWGGYSYAWNDAQTDAVLLPAGETRTLSNGQNWIFPSRADCMQCHTSAAGRALGPELGQLNKTMVYETTRRRSNQIDTLSHIGLLSNVGAGSSQPALVDPFGTAPVNERAKAYLHTNCSSCHRDGNDLRVDQDFRVNATQNYCNQDVIESLGISDAKILVPGDPEKSMLYVRANRRDVHAMPPRSSSIVDERGMTLMRDWISQLAACP